MEMYIASCRAEFPSLLRQSGTVRAARPLRLRNETSLRRPHVSYTKLQNSYVSGGRMSALPEYQFENIWVAIVIVLCLVVLAHLGSRRGK